MLPIPGLDGGNAIYPWLPAEWKRIFNTVRVFGFFIMLLLLWQTSFGRSLSLHLENVLISAGVPGNAIFYGQELFQTVPTTFAPVDRVPVTANYVIGPGDELLVRGWGQQSEKGGLPGIR